MREQIVGNPVFSQIVKDDIQIEPLDRFNRCCEIAEGMATILRHLHTQARRSIFDDGIPEVSRKVFASNPLVAELDAEEPKGVLDVVCSVHLAWPTLWR